MSQTLMIVMLFMMLVSTLISLCSFIYTVKRDRRTCTCKQAGKRKKRPAARVQYSKEDLETLKAIDKYPGGRG